MNLLDLLYLPAAAVTAPWWARKTRSGWGERFGHIEPIARASGAAGSVAAATNRPPRILLHAVSVGEVNTLRGLVPILIARGCEVVVSASTDTGLKRARELFGSSPNTFVTRYPLDFSPAVRRFFDAVDPDLVALVELEVWPNFVRACRDRKIPVGVINGRLSARSFRGYKRIRPFLRKTFASLAFVGAQDSVYAERFRAMGVQPDHLTITGSMKWDAIPQTGPRTQDLGPGTPLSLPADLLKQASDLARDFGINASLPLIVAGSTAPLAPHIRGPGGRTFDCEEALLHAACPPNVQLLCAPRKPEHYDDAFQALGGAERCVRRSETRPTKELPRADSSPSPHSSSPHSSSLHPHSSSTIFPRSRFLLDTIGELRAAYALADIAVIGRTWGSLGGSDPIESIALNKPTVLGPNFTNFETIVSALRDAGALVISDAKDLSHTLADLMGDPPRRADLAANGQACIESHRGATSRHAEMILGHLPARPSVTGDVVLRMPGKERSPSPGRPNIR
jgi:3-deoxy-D-manno-octulosonic-acid transferase